GPASDSFVVATLDTLFVIPFSGGAAEAIPAGGTGTEVVRPAQVEGCAYGAWAGSLRYVRACEGQDPVAETIPEADSSADLTLRVNQDLVVLNDQKFGLSWELMASMQLVDDRIMAQELQTSTCENAANDRNTYTNT